MARLFVIAILMAILVAAAAFFGAAQALGAHPLWAFDVALFGAVPGILLAMAFLRLGAMGIVFAVVDLALVAGVAWWGKRVFVASSGDDTFAGYLWFYGWIAVCACLVSVLALLALRLSGRADF